MTSHRCPLCLALIAVSTANFEGRIALFCRRCKAAFGDGGEMPRLTCACGKWLHNGSVSRGALRAMCRSCRTLVEFRANGPRLLEPGVRISDTQPTRVVAVGIRFDVFIRDDFRCVYCGRGPGEDALLEVDHLLPRSRGGPDAIENLVTACWECNRGKSNKSLDDAVTPRYAPVN